MAAPRFFSPVPLAPDARREPIELPKRAAHHAMRVLRLAVGDALTLFDGAGGEYAATLVRVDKRGAAVRIERFVPVERESPLAVTLAQAIAANDAMDSAIRKATELGVDGDPAARHRAQRAAACRRARRQAPRALAAGRRRGMRAVRAQSDSRRRRAAMRWRIGSRMGRQRASCSLPDAEQSLRDRCAAPRRRSRC